MATRGAALVPLISSAVLLIAGCDQTVAGTAKPAAHGPLSSPTTSSGSSPTGDLTKSLLSAVQVNKAMNATDIGIVDTSDGFSDNSDSISDTSCLGALYNAEQTVYDGTGWTDVADEVLTEPQEDSDHWVEQTIVRLPSSAKANDFFTASGKAWTNCIGKLVTIDDGENQYGWRFEGVRINGKTITQKARQTDSDGWACDHTLAVKDQYIIEVSACADALTDQSTSMTQQISDNLGS